MTWATPKTNWAASWDQDDNYTGDYFNVSDYNRITGNMVILQELALEVFGENISRSYTEIDRFSFYRATDINKIEDTLEDLYNRVIALDIGTNNTYSGNQPFPDADEWNRIESAQLAYYNMFQATKSIQYRLSFNLGRPTLGNR